MNTLQRLWEEHRQAVWLDFIERDLVTGDGLARMVAEDGVRGVTSNPSIFEKAIRGGGPYGAAVAMLLAANPEISTLDLYEALALDDIRAAADVLRPVWESSAAADGFVSLEVSPYLADDTKGTIDEAKRLWTAVSRPNLMIKVPATAAGIPAIEELIASGINVNATLMFSLDDYEAVAQAYVRGIGRCGDPSQIASVASFFVSRVDTKVDAALEAIGTSEALALRGGAAVANAKLAYRRFGEIFGGPDFAKQAARGARVQRPLWASTSAKNPAYRDVVYVEELIGPDTVNTLPLNTLEAFRDHGTLARTITENVAAAEVLMEQLAGLGIDMRKITSELQVEGVAAFASSFDHLLAALDAARPGHAAG
jgi:transaldolase